MYLIDGFYGRGGWGLGVVFWMVGSWGLERVFVAWVYYVDGV